MFIRAERTGNWHEHLEAMRLMLNLFAATAHINYAKSARLYLQKMQSLQFDHPSLYEQYCASLATIVSEEVIASGQVCGQIW